jgi:hypothetical protein
LEVVDFTREGGELSSRPAEVPHREVVVGHELVLGQDDVDELARTRRRRRETKAALLVQPGEDPPADRGDRRRVGRVRRRAHGLGEERSVQARAPSVDRLAVGTEDVGGAGGGEDAGLEVVSSVDVAQHG